MKPIRNSAKAIIVRDHQVLLTKNVDHLGDFYLFPGGGQEKGETLVQALVRECQEEIGREVEVLDLRHVREYIGANHEFAEWDSDIHQVEFYFECRLVGESDLFQGHNPDEYQVGVEWVDLSALDQIRLYPHSLAKPLMDQAVLPAVCYVGDTN
ncbi:NUDIX domain-containing protein [Paenibacillus solani]|uniref:NUDIX hydrolase n=1 Tax=Paenibacillus solani TaxID=1705565 RepID=A0A0M1P046_9BACL|nr:NUDIX domain-containing protein [Paenibacillus solani]KOR87645.1 NUDIX hydrolase [Paenibacillus solani]